MAKKTDYPENRCDAKCGCGEIIEAPTLELLLELLEVHDRTCPRDAGDPFLGLR
jgi:hypothetical protein